MSLTFQMRHDPDYWFLDDVSVVQGATEMISNGGFETGSLSPWTTFLLNGTLGSPAAVGHLSPHSGIYALDDGSNGQSDSLRQTFSAVAGQMYIVSFWLKSGATGTGTIVNVTLF